MIEHPRTATKVSTGKVYIMKRSSLWGSSEYKRIKPTVGSRITLMRLSSRPRGTKNNVHPRARGMAE